MDKLTPDDLYPLETYARLRPEFRERVIEHKAHRRLGLGEHITLSFEDRLTMHYQVQEMLRAERIFEPADIRAELDAYNPLIPDGTQLEGDAADRVPRRGRAPAWPWGGCGASRTGSGCASETLGRVYAIADEDMDRANDTKTSAVHFLRFELPPAADPGPARGRRRVGWRRSSRADGARRRHPGAAARIPDRRPGLTRLASTAATACSGSLSCLIRRVL